MILVNNYVLLINIWFYQVGLELYLGNRFWFCVLYRQLDHGCDFSGVII